MATPLLSLVVPPLQAAAIVLPSVMAQDIVTLWAYRRHWDAWNIKVLMPGLALGVGVAWLLATWLTAAHVRLAIGIIALTFVLRHWLGARFERLMPQPSAVTGWLF